MDFTTRYANLNSQQKMAVDTIDGPLMVIAGPGTGKTELLSMRVANILQKTDTLPENILCLTFTESGARAMRERLEQIIGPHAYKVAIHTFHSFGSDIINRYNQYFYNGANFRPADQLSIYDLLRNIFDQLDHNNPLASKMNGEYTHIADTITTISELKKSGLTSDELLLVLDANEQVLDALEKNIATVFSARSSMKTISALTPIAHLAANIPQPTLPPGITPLCNVIAVSIAHAVDEATSTKSPKPITAWKNKYLEKNDAGVFVFKDRKRIAKLRALSHVYYQYLLHMQEAELYDFDDMVLRVVHAIEVFPELRYNIQEQYQYILVDEFQDTNLAQARILHSLTSYENGDEPNIMVVGDDDQAIYSFQGAEVGNILNFRDHYKNARLVTLVENYRSAQPILEKARQVICQGSERLEHTIAELDKTLHANQITQKSYVKLQEYSRIDDERAQLVRLISQQIAEGTDASEITVIARRHHELVNLLPYFAAADISVNYERRDNVLESDVIVQLELLAKIISHIATQQLDKADALLPQLLAHPAWNIPAEDIWKLSLAAYSHHSGWLEEMAAQPSFMSIHTWLITQAHASLVQPAEYILDTLLGVPTVGAEVSEPFCSPLYHYFFDDETRNTAPNQYMLYLEALRTIRAKLREYHPGAPLKLHDFIEFIDTHHQLGVGITSVRARSQAQTSAVNLMTAHKAKGLEFDHVYIHGAIDSSWGERVRIRSRNISYPENLPLAPAGDSFDERLRLFFVAMTRARNTLTISYSLQNDSDTATARASFLTGNDWEPSHCSDTISTIEQTAQLQNEWYRPIVSLPQSTMSQLLAPTMEHYKLSATHLNNFLDISRGGPQYFLLNNLLRFPQAMSPSAAFGSAIHTALQRAHMHVAAHGSKKPAEDVVHDFETALTEKWLHPTDHEHFAKRGTDALHVFLQQKYASFTSAQKAELGFGNQHVVLQNARLTGALDLVSFDAQSKTISVTDYKTGKPATSWQAKNEYEKIKLHKYKQQLMFYKLLVENSRDYHNYRVEKGIIQFVEPTPTGAIATLELEFSTSEMDDFSRLVEAVYAHIVSLNLPDITHLSPDYNGILHFEAALLAEK